MYVNRKNLTLYFYNIVKIIEYWLKKLLKKQIFVGVVRLKYKKSINIILKYYVNYYNMYFVMIKQIDLGSIYIY
jgi:hypothetical protein